MKHNKMIHLSVLSMTFLLSAAVVGCSQAQLDNGNAGITGATGTNGTTVTTQTIQATQTTPPSSTGKVSSGTSSEAKASSGLVPSELFSERDLKQSVDLAAATTIQLESNKDVTLTQEGVYVLRGEVTNVTVKVEAAEDAKLQIVLDGARITNTDSPAIYVKAADKVFVTTTASKNQMEVSGTYVADGDTKLDAVIFSRADLTLNGVGDLEIVSKAGNGISSKDDLKITGGVYTITSSADALEANDAILIHDGSITINTGKDGLHSENTDDRSLGYIYMGGGTLNITAADDAIHGTSLVQVDGGTINIESCQEGIEATYIRINDGQITMYAKDDGINAAQKSNGSVGIEVNGGTIDIKMGSGDTDAFDANGNIVINGGNINVQAGSAFDADGTAQLNGGKVTVNGQEITEITVTRGGGGGGFGGGKGRGMRP